MTNDPVKPKIIVDYDALVRKHLPTDCGTVHLTEKIQGGNDTKLTDHPWLVALMYKKGNEMVHQCGGSIINERYVISAAHCPKPVSVRIGEWKFSENPDCESYFDGRKFCNPPVKDIIVHRWEAHPNYSKYSKQNDIALIRLMVKIKFNNEKEPLAFPICLPQISVTSSNDAVSDGVEYKVVGWGEMKIIVSEIRNFKLIFYL